MSLRIVDKEISKVNDKNRKMQSTKADSDIIVNRLADAPENVDRLRNDLGADTAIFNRNLEIGEESTQAQRS